MSKPDVSAPSATKGVLMWIVAAGLALRLLPLLWWDPEIASDAADYVRIATDLVQGRGFIDANGDPSSFRAPLYPLTLAFVFGTFGPSTRTVRVLQACLDVLTVVIVYRVVARTFALRVGTWAAPIAAGLVALNLAQIATSQRILSETLFTFLFVGGVAASNKWWLSDERVSTTRWAALTGFLLGVATLTRGVMIAYPLLLVLVAFGARRRWRRGYALLLACFALTLAPWTLRNYVAHGAFVPVSTQIGITLYASFNPPDGKFGFQPSDAVVREAEALPEAMASRVLTRAAIERALDDPMRTMRLEALKTLYFWSPVDWELLPRYGVVNPTYLWIVLMALGGLALGPVRQSLREYWPLLLPVGYLFAMALVFHGSPRYRLPVEPILAMVAAATVTALSARIGVRRIAAIALALAVFCGVMFVYSDAIRAWVRPWVSGL